MHNKTGLVEVTLEMYDQASGCWYTDPYDCKSVADAEKRIEDYSKLGSNGHYRITETTYYLRED